MISYVRNKKINKLLTEHPWLLGPPFFQQKGYTRKGEMRKGELGKRRNGKKAKQEKAK
jgi:hypothetical protein